MLLLTPLPALKNGYVTFGSFNHVAKVTPAVIETWSQILKAVPNSHLLLKSGMLDYDVVVERVREVFEKNGIEADRVALQGWVARADSPLDLYNSVDICLDTFPYNGTTTSFEALAMGLPVVTLEGDRHAGRVGASILCHLGYPEWTVSSHTSNIALARSMAVDLDALQKIREDLRARLGASSLCNAEDFTAKIEAEYRNIYFN